MLSRVECGKINIHMMFGAWQVFRTIFNPVSGAAFGTVHRLPIRIFSSFSFELPHLISEEAIMLMNENCSALLK